MTVTDDKPVDWVARVVAVVGAILGLCNAWLAYWKMRRDRRLSIDDDFWFRKIITPASIEPIVKGSIELLNMLPARDSTEDERKAFALKVTTEIQKLRTHGQVLALFGEDLPERVGEKLTQCEDILLDYCNGLVAEDASKAPSPIQVKQDVYVHLGEAMRCVRDRQMKS